MASKITKTNAVRLLESADIDFQKLHYDYPKGEDFSGEKVCELLNMSPEQSFKTLCARGKDNAIFVFSIPVAAELDLKKAAKAAGEKKVELVHVKELLNITGYERGSVSPVGLKKDYPVFIDETAILFDNIGISGGAKGSTLLISAKALCDFLGARLEDLT